MASLQKKGKTWNCQFYWQHHRFTFAVGRVTRPQAEAKATKADEIVDLLKRGVLSLPEGVDVATFVRHDGHPPAPVESQEASRKATLGELCDDYLTAHGQAQEAKTIYTARIHLNHLVETLGRGFDLRKLELSHLQRHVDRRCSKVAPATAAKEIATFRTAWNWGVRMKLVSGLCPVKGLIYPKVDEKPPFQTRTEIERQLDGLTDKQQEELWDALYLTLAEIDAFLAEVQASAIHPWIYPLVATAAHAGLRRSELVRVRTADVDFVAVTLTVRERKRAKGKRTTRRVPLSTTLAAILRDWLAIHPGGPYLFAQAEEVSRSKKRGRTTGHANGEQRPKSLKGRLASVSVRQRPGILPLTIDEVSDHFRRTVNGGAWNVLPGLHCLRHSFISACASKGIDQRLIDEWVGHQTDEQRRRYRHLYPSVQAEAIRSVFG
jgi:integrase